MSRRGRSLLIGEDTFFVTTTVRDFARVFAVDRYSDILIEVIKHYQRRYRFAIHGYVIMPSHFHWILTVNPALGTISDLMRDIKKSSAWQILDQISCDGRSDLAAVFSQGASGGRGGKRKFWMERFDDEVIRNAAMFRTKLDYMHNNPVRAGLVDCAEAYKYSSAKYYLVGEQSLLRVEIPEGF